MRKHLTKPLLSAVLAAGLCLALSLSSCFALPAQAKTADGKTVIVLDPGHGGSENGAIRAPFVEKSMSLFLAQWVQLYLSSYDNIEVYLTHTDDVDMSLKDRVDFAEGVNADFFACLHFNVSGGEATRSGSEVYVTIDPTLFPQEAYFAQTELDELHALGLDVRGIKFRVGSSGNDYYGITRRCTAYGMESALIEHCFLDSAKDRAFLGNGDTAALTTALQALAFVDADSIAKHLHLKSTMTGIDYTNYVDPAITWPILPYSDTD
ncbi:MAG: N-acetylmuramoyl-L-alanine amidase [Lachnospiraceae bacterium]